MSPLLNYTTKVPVNRTVADMHGRLAMAGARSIVVQYDDDREPAGFLFAIETPYGLQSFELPCDWTRVQLVLARQRQRHDDGHARRVAWRILKDWLEAQLALIETDMVTLDQVMLPYMRTTGGQTVYDHILERGLAALPAGEA